MRIPLVSERGFYQWFVYIKHTLTAGVLTVYYTGSLQFYGGVNFIILPTVKRSDNHFIIITP